MKPERWRLFVAVPVADEVKNAIAKFFSGLEAPYRFKAARPQFLHLTVRFLGDVPAADVPTLEARLAVACQRSTPFKLRAEGLGHFEHRVLWVGLHGNVPALHHLVSAVTAESRAFGDHVEKRLFSPHITIGKAAGHFFPRGKFEQWLTQHRSTAFGEWRVNHLELIRSVLSPRAARYTTLTRLPLGGSPPHRNANSSAGLAPGGAVQG